MSHDIIGDALPPSRAEAIAHVNRMVGERVMGWTVEQLPSDISPQFVVPVPVPDVPGETDLRPYRFPVGRYRPADDAELWLAVMRKMHELGAPPALGATGFRATGFALILRTDGRWSAGFRAQSSLYPDQWWGEAVADEPGQAICLAALIRVGVYDQDERLVTP